MSLKSSQNSSRLKNFFVQKSVGKRQTQEDAGETQGHETLEVGTYKNIFICRFRGMRYHDEFLVNKNFLFGKKIVILIILSFVLRLLKASRGKFKSST